MPHRGARQASPLQALHCLHAIKVRHATHAAPQQNLLEDAACHPPLTNIRLGQTGFQRTVIENCRTPAEMLDLRFPVSHNASSTLASLPQCLIHIFRSPTMLHICSPVSHNVSFPLSVLPQCLISPFQSPTMPHFPFRSPTTSHFRFPFLGSEGGGAPSFLPNPKKR
jgi:hypothetical protein